VRVRRSALRVVPWRDGLPEYEIESALETLGQEVDAVYLHLDLDALDPSVGLDIVDPPVDGGLSGSQLAELFAEAVSG
jgi:arginase family enzyme